MATQKVRSVTGSGAEAVTVFAVGNETRKGLSGHAPTLMRRTRTGHPVGAMVANADVIERRKVFDGPTHPPVVKLTAQSSASCLRVAPTNVWKARHGSSGRREKCAFSKHLKDSVKS